MRKPPISFDEFFNSIWLKIPDVWRNSDSEVGRPLQILTLTMAQQMYYYFYLKISAMDELFDPDRCPKEYLAFLASMVGWKLIGADPASWREQIKHAPLLYKIKGTQKSIVIAEKLIGYSVFMTELYRDYTGAIVPKERLFNTFPLHIKVKPWFRTTSVDIQKHIFTDAFSDLFPSFNEGTSTINSLGDLLHPKALKRTSTKYAVFSSLPGYDPKTGDKSLARLAKLPRINLVLKKDKDLDSVGIDGISTDATANEALSLLLQFKPFHVYINNLQVLYSLTDYLLGSSSINPGDGSSPRDAIILRESFGITGAVSVDGEDERISYRFNSFPSTDSSSEVTQDTSINKGNVVVKYRKLLFNALFPSEYVTDVNYLTSLGFSLKGYTRAILVNKPDMLWNKSMHFIQASDIVPQSSIHAVNASGNPLSGTTLLDIFNHEFSPSFFGSSINYSFVTVPFDVPNITHLHNFIPLTLPKGSTVTSLSATTNTRFMHDSVDISYLPLASEIPLVVTQSILTGDAWSLDGITKLKHAVPTLQKLSTGTPLNTVSSILNEVYSQGLLLVVSHEAHNFILQEADFKLDSANKRLVINMHNVITKMEQYFSLPPAEESTYLPTLTIHVVYVEKEPIKETFNIDYSINRGTNISSKRSHSKFTRYKFIDTTLRDTLRTTQSTERLFELNSTGVIEEDFNSTRGFHTELPIVYSRRSLFDESRSGSPVLHIDAREPRNEKLWTLLKPSPASYIGAYPVVTDFFANYYNLDLYSTPLDSVSYSSIDMSSEAQIINRSSAKWKDLISKVSPVQKEHFLVSRDNDFKRVSSWTRGSALKTSRPFIGASRAHVQPFRNDITAFSRKDNLGDYATSTVVNYPHLGNYRYSTSNNSDATFTYFSLSGATSSVSPTSNEFIYLPEATKTTISSSGDITYPLTVSNISQYSVPLSSLYRDRYYSNSTSSIPSFSLYAGNIRFDINPMGGELFTTLHDSVDIDISGLQKQNLVLSGSSLAGRQLVLDYNTYVVWRETNTGNTVNIGLAPDVSYSLVRPNIRVLHNGIELSAGPNWILSDNPITVLFDPSVVIEPADSFNIEYETLGTPVHTDPRLVPQTGLTSVYDEITTIGSLNYEYLKVIHFANCPVIEWTDGPTYCGWSEAVNNSSNSLAPFPLTHQHTAVPNIEVDHTSGINVNTLVYGIDYQLRAIPATVSYCIQLSQKITDSLLIGDDIRVTYKHR